MFDSEFQVSETYFSVLQMLRIFNDWIEETEADWHVLSKRVTESCFWIRKASFRGDWTSHPIIRQEDLDKNFGQVKTNLETLAARLKKRIEKKRTEVESLRDGVSMPAVPIILIFIIGSC